MMKILGQVNINNLATHRYKNNSTYIYCVGNSSIEVSRGTGIKITEIEVKNGDKWESVT